MATSTDVNVGALLDAAETLLTEQAPRFGAREVATHAGLSTGTLYHYFGSLDRLLLAVAQRAVDRQRHQLATLGAAALLDRVLDETRRDTILPALRLKAINAPDLRAAIRAYDEALAGILVDALDPEHANVQATRTAVEIVRSLAEGFQLRAASGTLAEPGEDVRKLAAQMILATVRTEAAASR